MKRKLAVSFTATLTALAAMGCGDGEMKFEDVGSVSSALVTTGTTYEIKGVQSGKCVDIVNAGTANGDNVQQWSCHGGTNQQFTFESMGSGYYRIKNVKSGKCLDVWGASSADGANVAQYTCGTGYNQQFQVVDDGGGVHHFLARHSGKSLDVSAFSTADGGNIQQWSWLAGNNQKFALKQVGNPIDPNLSWSSSGPLVAPHNPDYAAVKDPTVVYHNGKYHVYATVFNKKSTWQMIYFNFTDWSQAGSASQYAINQVSGFSGYNCAPQMFYFPAHNKWYLIYQSQQPRFSTVTNIDEPWNLTAPANMFTTTPSGMPSLPIDYYVICDDSNCHLFFTGDDGKLYRTQTSVGNFPHGWGSVSVALTYPTSILFEGSSHYKILGQNNYLTVIEGMGSNGRWFAAWTASNLAGPWSEFKISQSSPFAGLANVTFPGGKWTNDISHGELIRYQNDHKSILDPNNMRFVYQGRDPASDGMAYELLPYRLGLLTQN